VEGNTAAAPKAEEKKAPKADSEKKGGFLGGLFGKK